ncbi:MAG: esterase/lipase family protein, partial [Anaerolineales bacterium]
NRVCLGDGAGGFSSCADVHWRQDSDYGVALGDLGDLPAPTSTPTPASINTPTPTPTATPPTPSKPVVVLVHGFQGLSPKSDLTCDPNNFTNSEIVDYSALQAPTYAVNYWGDMPAWLEQDYDVWVAQLKTGLSQGTPSLGYNAACLRNQINHVVQQTGQLKVTIVAHSMGGLVSRACLSLRNCGGKVDKLVTLGSPHAGLPAAGIANMLRIDCRTQPGACDMSYNKMHVFNGMTPNRRNVDYYFIGGDGTGGPSHWQQPFWYALGAGQNDGLVGKYSAVGWVWPSQSFVPGWWDNPSPPAQYWTDEFHSTAYAFDNGAQVRNDYYHYRLGSSTLRSHAYECFTSLLQGQSPPSDKCADANTLAQTFTLQTTTPSQLTQVIEGNLTTGQTLSPTLQIDTSDETLFYLSWYTGTLNFSLKRPDGQLIDPAYATNNPAEVAYGSGAGGAESPPFATYSFTSTLPGEWTLIVDASALGAPDTDFWTFGLLETDRTMAAGIDEYYYNAGMTATLTATLQSGGAGFSGAAVVAEITRADGVTDTVTLAGQGSGNYAASYTIPNSPGYLNITIVATGNDNGTDFTRQSDLLAVIAPQDAQFTGTYSDQPNDDNGDSLYESLDFTAEVNAANPGDYLVSALLVSGSGQLIANVAVDVSLTAGVQSVTLSFDGDD